MGNRSLHQRTLAGPAGALRFCRCALLDQCMAFPKGLRKDNEEVTQVTEWRCYEDEEEAL
jgi:hypothetical protein